MIKCKCCASNVLQMRWTSLNIVDRWTISQDLRQDHGHPEWRHCLFLSIRRRSRNPPHRYWNTPLCTTWTPCMAGVAENKFPSHPFTIFTPLERTSIEKGTNSHRVSHWNTAELLRINSRKVWECPVNPWSLELGNNAAHYAYLCLKILKTNCESLKYNVAYFFNLFQLKSLFHKSSWMERTPNKFSCKFNKVRVIDR